MRRFVIESAPRCGSRMLQTALTSHPDVVCGGELFNIDSDEYLGASSPTRSQADLLCEFFARHAVAPATGFQLFRAFDSDWQPLDLAAVASELSGAVVLCLQRRNLLRAYLSHSLARRDGEWEHLVGSPGLRDTTPIRLEPERVVAWVDAYHRGYDQARAVFPHPLEIVYEDMCRDWEATTARILRALGVRPLAIAPRTQRVGRPLRTAIANYDELAAQFAGGPFAAWFDDEPDGS
jgi:LPS sulfotransferase NodH